MTPIVALAAARAQEQIDRGAWMVPDPDENVPPPACVVCEGPLEPSKRRPRKVCLSCATEGWTAATCACGRPLHRRDQKAKLRCRCGTCRREILEVRHDDSAQSVKAPRRPAVRSAA